METYNYSGFHLNGFYVKRIFSLSSTVQTPYIYSDEEKKQLRYVYIKIREQPSDSFLYLYPLHNQWIICHHLFSSNGIAYTYIHKSNTYQLSDIINNTWFILQSHNIESKDTEIEYIWVEMKYTIIYPSIDSGNDGKIYSALQLSRSINYNMKEKYKLIQLRNSLLMPRIGLGTGGIYPEDLSDILITAISYGYQLVDLAREYSNEYIIGDILLNPKLNINKTDLFIITKVWPTQLGFSPTLQAMQRSIDELRVPYIDMYLIHWPMCYPDIEWMRCGDIEDTNGSWEDSWQAFEKKYAEGKVNSIGVSNFDRNLLDIMTATVSVLPHIVQNYASIGYLDIDVQDWCFQHLSIFQPYSAVRNINEISSDHLSVIDSLAIKYNKSMHEIILRFFLQLENAIIPRSLSSKHLKDNMDLFSFTIDSKDMDTLKELDEQLLSRIKDEI